MTEVECPTSQVSGHSQQIKFDWEQKKAVCLISHSTIVDENQYLLYQLWTSLAAKSYYWWLKIWCFIHSCNRKIWRSLGPSGTKFLSFCLDTLSMWLLSVVGCKMAAAPLSFLLAFQVKRKEGARKKGGYLNQESKHFPETVTSYICLCMYWLEMSNIFIEV